MKKYEEMSNFELNKRVAEYVKGEQWWHKYSTVLTEKLRPSDCGGMETKKSRTDWCTLHEDAWPLFIEEGITVVATERMSDNGDLHEAFCVHGFLNSPDNEFHAETLFSSLDEKPLRAGVICFLRKKDYERGLSHE